jgi:hypothetical protein
MSEWISVKNKWPIYGQLIATLRVLPKNGCNGEVIYFHPSPRSHTFDFWMPLPTPPKEQA